VTKKNKKRVEGYAGQEPPTVNRTEAARDAHRPVVETCARAAVRVALGLRQVFLVRSRVSAVLAATARSVGEAADAVAQWKCLLVPKSFDLTDAVLELGLADTRAAKICLERFGGQVSSLHDAYGVARAASPVAAFQILRGVSHGLLLDSNEEVRAAWRYVLQAWGQLDPEAPKIALWQPDLDATVEEKFKFCEVSRTWKYQKRDGSWSVVEASAR
jgi:hypothetical protein